MNQTVNLRLYDTRARAIRDFEPLRAGKVTMYVCGATVQSPPHLGHVRGSVSFDVLRRWLLHLGLSVTYVRNVTDVEDKVMAKAEELGEAWWAIAYRNERAFSQAYDLLGSLPATIEPRATGHVPEIIELIGRLIESGHAYPSGGDVLFDVRSYDRYGELSGQKPDDLQPAGDTENAEAKRDQRDFALWKRAKPGEPAWSSPWGPGRPGWHIECSAMSVKYLGREFDIHGGGIDLMFPHHENEIAQSVCAGDPFARYWLHNAWVTMSGEKMSKSLGNGALVSEVLQRFRPVEMRFYLASPHYRSHIEYSEDALQDAAAAYRRLESFVRHTEELVGPTELGSIPDAFTDAMNDDLGTPHALAVVYGAVRDGNTALAAGEKERARLLAGDVRAMLGVLGLDPLDPHWTASSASSQEGALRTAVDRLVNGLLVRREAARAAKDWATADALRDQIREAGVEVADSPDGARWSLREDRS